MKTIQINNQLSISGQLTSSDVKTLASNGIKVLICNRPDGEATDQPSYKEIEAAAIESNITFINIPFSGISVPADSLTAFLNIIDTNKSSIHAYCRTGNRCSILWGLSYARTHSVEETVLEAHTHGFNYKPVVLEQLQTVSDKYNS